MKKLKLRIAKFNRLLVVEQLELEGEWKNSEHVYVRGDLFLFKAFIDLRGNIKDRSANYRLFSDNAERDEYAQKLVNWITEEQFGGLGKLVVGKECLVSDDGEGWSERIYAGKSAKQLGEEKRFLSVHIYNENFLIRWKYAKPLNNVPKIDGEFYTWETEE